jgi:hypothetical protein
MNTTSDETRLRRRLKRESDQATRRDPEIVLYLKSGRTFRFLWGEPADVERHDHERQIAGALEHLKTRPVIYGRFEGAGRTEIAAIIEPTELEAIEAVI